MEYNDYDKKSGGRKIILNTPYIYKSTGEDILRVIELLDEKGIEYHRNESDELVIGIDSEKNKDYMMRILAITIALDYFIDLTKEYGDENNWREDDIDDYIANETNPFPPYYSFLTEIVLREALKKSSKINVPAFRKFNLKGFKDEVHGLLKMYEDYVNSDDEVSDLIKEFYGEDATIDDFVNDVAESFKFLEDKAFDDGGLDRNDYEVIDVKYVPHKGYRLTTISGKELTMDYLKESLNLNIVIETNSSEEPDEFVSTLALINFILSIFKPRKFIIDKSVNVIEYNQIVNNLSIQMELIGFSTIIEYDKKK